MESAKNTERLLDELADVNPALWYASSKVVPAPLPGHFYFINCAEKIYNERREWIYNNIAGRHGFDPCVSNIEKFQAIPIFRNAPCVAFENQGDAAFYLLTFSESNT